MQLSPSSSLSLTLKDCAFTAVAYYHNSDFWRFSWWLFCSTSHSPARSLLTLASFLCQLTSTIMGSSSLLLLSPSLLPLAIQHCTSSSDDGHRRPLPQRLFFCLQPLLLLMTGTLETTAPVSLSHSSVCVSVSNCGGNSRNRVAARGEAKLQCFLARPRSGHQARAHCSGRITLVVANFDVPQAALVASLSLTHSLIHSFIHSFLSRRYRQGEAPINCSFGTSHWRCPCCALLHVLGWP